LHVVRAGSGDDGRPVSGRGPLGRLRERFLSDEPAARARRMAIVNRFARASVLGDGPAVTLTSRSERAGRAFVTIETIAKGTRKPSELILWLDDPALVARPPASLRRLMRRGLQVRLAENLGPHTKYFPYLLSRDAFDRPLVTADDDMLYPIDWLAELAAAAAAHPEDIVCHRARHVQMVDGAIGPYLTWPLVGTTDPSPLHCATGVSGVAYPPTFLAELKARGEGFRSRAPRADDIWLHAAAVGAGRRIRQVAVEARNYPTVPDTQEHALQDENVLGGGNDVQIAAAYEPEEVARLAAAWEAEGR
jgi:hypothetical protein